MKKTIILLAITCFSVSAFARGGKTIDPRLAKPEVQVRPEKSTAGAAAKALSTNQVKPLTTVEIEAVQRGVKVANDIGAPLAISSNSPEAIRAANKAVMEVAGVSVYQVYNTYEQLMNKASNENRTAAERVIEATEIALNKIITEKNSNVPCTGACATRLEDLGSIVQITANTALTFKDQQSAEAFKDLADVLFGMAEEGASQGDMVRFLQEKFQLDEKAAQEKKKDIFTHCKKAA